MTIWLASSSAEELLEALDVARAGLRDLEDALAGMKAPPEDLVAAADRIRRGLGDAEHVYADVEAVELYEAVKRAL
jgi:hypothetical protein